MNIVPASQNSFAAAVNLLQDCGLPTEDINPGTQLFVMEDGDKVIGTVAVEYDWNDALLRSLSVEEGYRDKGIGKQLVDFAEDYVKKQGVLTIFLLTTTADDFFLKRGYKKTDRATVPGFIKNTSEFSVTCSSAATLMKKELA
jgi:amino-acid N-acetyltransferase